MSAPHSPPSVPPALADWRRRGRRLEIFGLRIFVLDTGPPPEGPSRRPGATQAPPLLVLHGFPTFSRDFHRVLPTLSRRHRVILHDHPGFGLSSKPERWSYSLVDQAEVALEVWRRLGVTEGHLLAHDYGTSVATELLARRERGLCPLTLRSVTLCNGSVYLRLARLRPSQRLLRSPWAGPLFARLVSRRFFARRLRALVADPASLPDDEIAVLWAGVSRAEGVRRAPAVSSYLGDRLRFAQRWHPPLERLDLPAHVLWGRRDPVAVPAIAERLAAALPNPRLTWLDEVGHYPMLEAPEAFAQAVLKGLPDAQPGPAGRIEGC